jgi:ribonuclease HI
MASPHLASSHNGSRLTTYSTEIFIDWSKIGDKVRVGVAIYTDNRLVRTYKYRLQSHCSNNQTQQIAILKSLEQLPSLED